MRNATAPLRVKTKREKQTQFAEPINIASIPTHMTRQCPCTSCFSQNLLIIQTYFFKWNGRNLNPYEAFGFGT